jgi:hypothetical protein
MPVTNNYEVELLTTQYTAQLEMLLQQKGSRLRGAVRTGAHVGKMASPVQYVGTLKFNQTGGRGTPIVPQLASYQRRWVTPNDRDLAVQVDTFDELRSIIDPRSALTASVQAAADRLFDDMIISAFFGSAQLGVDASSLTTETFDSGSDFPVSVTIADTFGAGSSTGLTIKKLIEAKRILLHYENDLDGAMPHIAFGSQQWADLMAQLEFVSTEFRERPVYDTNGQPKSFMGFQIHMSERLPSITSNTIRECPVWMEEGMYLGVWMEPTTNISQETHITSQPWQAYSKVSLGATRLQGGKVLMIKCADTTGVPLNG